MHRGDYNKCVLRFQPVFTCLAQCLFVLSLLSKVTLTKCCFVCRNCPYAVSMDRPTAPRREGSWRVRLSRALSSLTGPRCWLARTGTHINTQISSSQFVVLFSVTFYFSALTCLSHASVLSPQLLLAVLAGPSQSCCSCEGQCRHTFPWGIPQAKLQLQRNPWLCQLYHCASHCPQATK